MVRLIVLYGHPADPTAFDRHYTEIHLPLADKIPNCQGASWGHLVTLDGSPAAYYLSAVLEFESVEVLREAFAGPEGVAAANDLGNFATGGVTMLIQQDN